MCIRDRIDILHHWHEALDKDCTVRAAFIDYAKAFDHVDHSIVIQKLIDIGISKILVRWTCSFLSERQQRVKFSQFVSNWLTLNVIYLGPLSLSCPNK